MLLTLKNKMMMAFNKVITEAEKVGGIPGKILITPDEAVDFIKEMRDESNPRTDIKITKKGVQMITLEIIRKDKITSKEMNDVVRSWYKNVYQITYKHVPIVVVKPEKSEEEKETERGPVKPFNCYGITDSSQDYD